MSTAILELPVNVELHEGEPFSWQIDGVAHDGKLVVRRLVGHESFTKETSDPLAVSQFLELCQSFAPSPLSQLSDVELDDLRLQHLKEKHLNAPHAAAD